MVETIVNGFDVQKLQALREMVKNQPQVGQAVMSSKVTWKGGFHSEASIKDYKAGGMTNTTSRSKPFVVPQDYPPEIGGGKNEGPTAGELLIAALGHCIAPGFAKSATAMGLNIDSLTVEIEGDIDMQGSMGLPKPGDVRPGFQEIRAKYHVRSKATREDLEKAMKMGEQLSPVKDSLRAVKFSSQLFVE